MNIGDEHPDGVWGIVTKFYKEKFQIDSDVVTLLSELDILLLCVSGSSNSSIATFLELEPNEVSATIRKYFSFDGWEQDLCLNPIGCYRSLDELSFDKFVLAVGEKCTGSYNLDMVSKMYSVCATYTRLEEVINEKWV